MTGSNKFLHLKTLQNSCEKSHFLMCKYLRLFTPICRKFTKVLICAVNLDKFQVIFTSLLSNMDIYENTIY
jgi:hypothetical protein